MTDLVAVDYEALEFSVIAWPDRARALPVTSPATYEQAAELLKAIKALRAEIANSCDPIIASTNKAHQAALHQKRELEAPLEEAEKILKRSLAAFVDAEERKRREEEARRAAEARERDEAAKLEEAAALEAAGEPEAATRVLEAPSVAPPPVVESTVPAVAGVSTREVWRGVVTDIVALCKGVAEGRVPVTAVTPHMPAINSAARAMRAAFAWDGCRAVCDRQVAARSR
jgi:hypothetical protein